jgi:hypothetical protein
MQGWQFYLLKNMRKSKFLDITHYPKKSCPCCGAMNRKKDFNLVRPDITICIRDCETCKTTLYFAVCVTCGAMSLSAHNRKDAIKNWDGRILY